MEPKFTSFISDNYSFLLKEEKREKGLLRRYTSDSILNLTDDPEISNFKQEVPPINVENRPPSLRNASINVPPVMEESKPDKKYIKREKKMSIFRDEPIRESVQEEEQDAQCKSLKSRLHSIETEGTERKPSYKKSSFFVEQPVESVENAKLIYRNINSIYEFKGRIRNGTTTIVNKYYSKILDKDIAIKIIHKEKTPIRKLIKFLHRELDIAADLDLKHRNIVEYIEVYDITLRSYIMMEYVDNGNLTDLIRTKGRLDPMTYQLIFKQLLDAVNYCLNNNICHRKLSTDNCLITKRLQLKLCDFSYARYIEDCKKGLNTYCGVLGFTAPEVLMCRKYPPNLSEAWSCGVILFAMIYGVMPFDSSSYARLLKQIREPIKFQWYCDTPSHAIMIMFKTISPIRRRWSVQRVLNHSWVTPPTTAGADYYLKWLQETTKLPPPKRIREKLEILQDLMKIIFRKPGPKKEPSETRSKSSWESNWRNSKIKGMSEEMEEMSENISSEKES